MQIIWYVISWGPCVETRAVAEGNRGEEQVGEEKVLQKFYIYLNEIAMPNKGINRIAVGEYVAYNKKGKK